MLEGHSQTPPNFKAINAAAFSLYASSLFCEKVQKCQPLLVTAYRISGHCKDKHGTRECQCLWAGRQEATSRELAASGTTWLPSAWLVRFLSSWFAPETEGYSNSPNYITRMINF